ncbi:MAG: hypothetical protein K2O41_07505 [Clostridia bacterium]|nr:hypothetical protein [Clostridia bacterium]
MVNYKGKSVIYTFKYGGYESKKTRVVLIAVPSALILLSLIIFLVLSFFSLTDALYSLILFVIGLAVLVPIVIVLVKNTKHDKEISVWLEDENLFETTAIPWEFSSQLIGFGVYYRFGVDFEKDGASYRKISSGYDAFYKRIKDTQVNILYSPKYDEVMILKD